MKKIPVIFLLVYGFLVPRGFLLNALKRQVLLSLIRNRVLRQGRSYIPNPNLLYSLVFKTSDTGL